MLAAAFAIGFLGVVAPLITSGGGTPHAEVNGHLPSTIAAGSEQGVPLAVDNTSDAIIRSVCVRVTADPAGVVSPVSVRFQGTETAAFSGATACGGGLSGGEVISADLVLRGSQPGNARLTVVIVDRAGAELGPQLHGVVDVAPPAG